MIHYSSEGKKGRLYLTVYFEIFRVSSFETKCLRISKNVPPVGVFQKGRTNLGFGLVFFFIFFLPFFCLKNKIKQTEKPS